MNKRLLQAAKDVLAIFPEGMAQRRAEHPAIQRLADEIEWQTERSEVFGYGKCELELLEPSGIADDHLAAVLIGITEVGIETKDGEPFRLILYFDDWGRKALIGMEAEDV